MQFTLLSILSIATARAIVANPFTLVTVHSGSDVQYKQVKLSSDNSISLNGETLVTFNIDSESRLFANGNHVSLESGALKVTPDSWDGAKWSVEDGHLLRDGHDAFVVCPNINSNIDYAHYGVPSNCENPIGVVLHANPGEAQVPA